MFAKKLFCAVALFLIGIQTNTFSQTTVKIMPLGNSVTLGTGGSTPLHGYRNTLYDLLEGDGINFNFVGQFADDDGSFDGDHQGIAGMRADSLVNLIDDYLTAEPAEMVILHIGTNDVAGLGSVNPVFDNIENVVDAIYIFDENIKIVLCSLTPRNDTPTRESVTSDLAARIRDLVDEKKADGYKIWFADIYNAFVSNGNWAQDYMSADGFHPKNPGYEVMGNALFPVVKLALASNNPGVVDEFNRPGPSLGSNWKANSVYQIVNNELSNTSTDYVWGQMAVWQPNSNPVSVSFRWGLTANAQGIDEGGLVLRLNSSNETASGYLLWISATRKRLQLWTIVNGQPGQSVDSFDFSEAVPKAGDVFKVILRTDSDAHYFDCYVNNVLYGTVQDENKLQGNTSPHYAGIMLRGALNNNIDDFDFDKIVDFTPPAAITDLSVPTVSGTIVQLQWTAPGGDGNTGSATQYDVRYSTSPITENTFAFSTPATGAPTPSVAGTLESMSVAGLAGGVEYYFAVKAKDEAGNISPISNVATATTANSIVVSDDFERETLGPNWTANPAFNIVTGELQNTSTVQSWNFMAVYNARKNPISMQFQWGTTADTPGINEAGFALMLDSASTSANGYLLFRQASSGQIRLWTIENGAPGHSIGSAAGQSGVPKAGDIMRVDLSSDENGNYFDLYINGKFDGTVSDPAKEQGNGSNLFAGFMVHGDLNNPVDNFELTTAKGTASQVVKFSGDLQEGSFGETLLNPLIAQVLDKDNNPIPGETVKFEVTTGAGTIQSNTGAFNLRVNIGGSASYVDVLGNTWEPEQQYSPGSFGYIGGNVDLIPKPIGNTQDDVIYQSERYGLSAFKADIPPGQYTIVMHFSESFMQSAGLRVFSVNIEGVPVLVNFDIFAEAGARYVALKKTFNSTVTDGVLDLDFQQFVDTSLLNGIEILSSDALGVSDANGQVSRLFTLGNIAGLNEITVTPQSFTGNPAVFSVTNLGGPATQIVMVSGNGQNGAAGQQLSQPFVVEVRDAGNNPKAKFPVEFLVTRGGGLISEQQPILTGPDGRASAKLILGNQNATNKVVAIAGSLSGSPIEFTATSASGVGSALQSISGNNQAGTVGGNLFNQLVVRVIDTSNQPVPNFPAGFFVTRGGGSTSASAPILNSGFESDFYTATSGTIANDWVGGNDVGTQVFSKTTGEGTDKQAQRISTTGAATVASLSQEIKNPPQNNSAIRLSLKYKTTGNSDAAFTVVVRNKNNIANELLNLAYPGTNDQWRQINHDFTWDSIVEPAELILILQDNQVVDIDAFNIAHLTDANGQLSATWTLGDTAMVQEVEAVAFQEGEPITASTRKFFATANAGPAQTMDIVSGNNQVGAANQPLSNPFKVLVKDANGNGKANHPVTFAVTEGGGTLDGSLTKTVNTAADGIAAAILTLGPNEGVNNKVSVSSNEGGTPLTNSPLFFEAVAANPSKMVRLTGNQQNGTATQPLDEPFKVLILDNLDRPISGYPVLFEVKEGGGTVNGQTTTIIHTASNGEASGTLVLGPTPSATNSVEVSASSQGTQLTGSPVIFSATAASLSALQLVDGNNQTGAVGGELASALKVKVGDTRSKGIRGWPVTFTIKDGGGKFPGDVTTATVNTDSLGLAVIRLTLGGTPGVNNNIVEATASFNNQPLNGSPIVFQASASVGTPVALVVAGGDKQRGVVGLPLPQPLQIKVVDALNNGIPNHEVTFEVKAGGGNFSGATTKKIFTNQSGVAQVTLTVGIVSGEDNNIVEARAFSGNTPLGNSPILFTASATSSSARFMTYISGNLQQGIAGQQLPKTLVVKVTDATQNKNPVPNHPVIFTVKVGGGTLNGPTESEVVVSTNTQGEAQVNWFLGGLVAPDSQFVEAASTDGQQPLTGSAVKFAALAKSGPTNSTVSNVEATGPVPADGNSKSSVKVFLKDKFGNPISGHAVSVRVSGDGNSVGQPLSLTDTEGKVEAEFSSIRSGMKIVTAFDINSQTEVTNGDSVNFTPLEAQRLIRESGDGQTRNSGTALANPLITKVTDLNGNPVSQWPVEYAVLSGGGYFIENQPIMTGIDGMAKATFVLGPNAGQNSIQATALNLSSPPVGFTVTGKAGTATQVTSVPGSNGQMGVAGELLPSPVGVIVMDANGDPIAGHSITFSITFGDGTVNDTNQTTVVTDPFGIAQAVWRLGEVSGPNVLEAIAPSMNNAKEIFTAQGVEGLASNLEFAGNQTINGTVSSQASSALTVRVVDNHGNPIKNFIVRFQIMSGTGSLSATEATTNSDGFASVSFTFGSDAGERLVRAFGTGLANSPLTFFMVGNASAPKAIAVYDGNNQTGTIGKPLSRSTRVIVKDTNGNPVPGVNVTYLPTQNNGSFPGGPVVTTDKRGVAASTWNLGTSIGANKAWAIVQGLQQVEFIANGVTNNLPVFQEIAPKAVNELQKVEFTVSATDADGETITYSIRNLPPGASFDSLLTRIFIWNTGFDNAGFYEVIFSAKDSKGDIAEYIVPITVNNVNQAPRITNWQPAADNILVLTGQTQVFEVNAIDPDGDELGCLWFLDGKHVGSSHTYFYQPSTTGARTLEAKLFDHADTTSRSWKLDVITSVQLSSFTAATQAGEGVKLEWFTARETDNAGFNVLRSYTEFGNYKKINNELIKSDGTGQYTYLDSEVVFGRLYYYKLEDVSFGGEKQQHGPVMVDAALPKTYALQQNYPNPFNPSTNIRYQLPAQADVKLVVYNILGQEVRRLIDEKMQAGYHTVTWDGRNAQGLPVPSGVYYYKITAGDFSASKKMLLIK